MEIAAVAKNGVHIYKFSEESDSLKENIDPVVTLPSAGSAFGYAFSNDGEKLASVVEQNSADPGKAIIWDPNNGYKKVLEIPGVGETGGARACLLSPRGSFLITFEKYDKEKAPENMHVWDLRNSPEFKKLRSFEVRSYTSGAITDHRIQWSPDESLCLELISGEGLVVLDPDLKAEASLKIPEPNASQFSIAPVPQNGGFSVAIYIPEAMNSWGAWDLNGRAGEVAVWHVKEGGADVKKSTFQTLTRKLNSCTLQWNADGTGLLAQADSDVDESGESYFGTSSLYWIKADGKAQCRIAGPEDGLVQDAAWNPVHNEFLIIIGMMPATTKLYDGKTGKLVKDGTLGTSRRNTIRWDPFGRFFAVGGFGALPGDMDFFDRPSGETLCSFRAALTVKCCWGPSGRHFLTCTTTPRMNQDNQISVWHYQAGEKQLQLDFKPADDAEGGGRKAADAGAMLWAASWRPGGKGQYKDRPASPPPKGVKRVKGLPPDAKSSAGAFRAKGTGGGFNAVAAMMSGELAVPDGAGNGDRGWAADPATGAPAAAPPPKLTWAEQAQQQKEWEKEKKKVQKQQKGKEAEAKEAAKDEVRGIVKKQEEDEKKLKKLKEELAALELLKDKEWDELTDEDEAQLEGELDIIAQIKELENRGVGKTAK